MTLALFAVIVAVPLVLCTCVGLCALALKAMSPDLHGPTSGGGTTDAG